MDSNTPRRLVPYDTVSPGLEAVYTAEEVVEPLDDGDPTGRRRVDEAGNAYEEWSVWTWFRPPEKDGDWGDEEINCLNRMQAKLGHLDDDIRRVRAHVGSLVPCDSGFPVTVDELLRAIGRGKLDAPSFHNGCWRCAMWWEASTTQAGQAEVMQTIEDVVRGYLDGVAADEMATRFPAAEGFIRRTYEWLGPAEELTQVQRLMLERMLLPFEYFAQRNEDYESANRECFEPGGRGAELDARVSGLAGLPAIHKVHLREFRENLSAISDPESKALYENCCHIASGIHGLSDCHHAAFHRIEYWIHGIGTGKSPDGEPPVIPTRMMGAERERLGRLLFGYVLALDKWLVGRPMQFLLLDLGHADLGFDPRNEVLRVYAYLGDERTPVKEWLAGCLWRNLTHNSVFGNPAGLAGHRHKHLVQRADQVGISVREWMDSVLGKQSGCACGT